MRPRAGAGIGATGRAVGSRRGPPGSRGPAHRPVAVLERLTYTYPAWSDRPRPALADVDLVLGTGVTWLAGDSGAGKSTLLRVLNGLVPHFHGGRFAGSATVAGLDVVASPTRDLARHVGFVFQEPESGFVRGTVEREVAFGPENLGLDPADIRRRVADALERVGIEGLAARRLRTLSGGERQRVALAAALASGPRVVALDEPMSQLDAAGAATLERLLASLAEGGATVVVAEHRADRLTGADRVVRLAGGSVVAPDAAGGAAGAGQVELAAAGDDGLLAALGPRDGPGCRARAPGTAEAFALRGATIGVAGRALASDVDLAGEPGDIVLVTGANGAGKTTLLRTIAGLASPLAGSVERRPGRVAYLPQEPGVLLHRASVRAEVEQTLRWSGTSGDVQALLAAFGLAELAERDPRDLSGGQRQRAALAVVLAGGPMIALLDEPTRGMDAAARRALSATVHTLAAGGAAVVVATHDDDLARDLGGRTVHLAGGALVPRGGGALP